MRFTRSLLHAVESATAKPVVAPRLRERLRAHEISELAEYIKTSRVQYQHAFAEYEALQSQKNKSEDAEANEGVEVEVESLFHPPQAQVPLEGNAYFHTLPAPLAAFFTKYPPAPFRTYSAEPVKLDDPSANPFLANINPITGKRHDPVYSLRRQSDLYKAAYRYGIEHLLPPLSNGKMFYEEKYEKKPVVRGATRFKLSIAERKAPERKVEMQEAISKADEAIAAARGSKWRKKMEKKNKKPLPWF